MTTERWLPVPEWEDRYEVSDLGRVRGLRSGVFITPVKLAHGYRGMTLFKPGTRKREMIHRLVLTAFIPPPSGDVETDHINADRADNRLVNLRWVTRQENLRLRELNQGRGYLTDKQVEEIRAIEGISQRAIARLYDVSQGTVSNIKRGVTRAEPAASGGQQG